MRKDFSSETLDKVLTAYPGEVTNGRQSRTPLHIPFSSSGIYEPAKEIDIRSRGEGSMYDELAFNAIGSRLLRNRSHKPVLDIDGGVHKQERVKFGSKVILAAAYEGSYSPKSMLRDVLGDNGIDLEVFTAPKLMYAPMTGGTYLERMQVAAIVLRSAERDVFEVVDSTTKGHSHLYIQQEIPDIDHSRLIFELGAVGIISSLWQSIVEQEGMGIVRTPWTKKDTGHLPS